MAGMIHVPLNPHHVIFYRLRHQSLVVCHAVLMEKIPVIVPSAYPCHVPAALEIGTAFTDIGADATRLRLPCMYDKKIFSRAIVAAAVAVVAAAAVAAVVAVAATPRNFAFRHIFDRQLLLWRGRYKKEHTIQCGLAYWGKSGS